MALSQQVTNTLQALANRPGVESTLILSRSDGSIIKVTGSLEEPRLDNQENSTTSPPPPGSPTPAGTSARNTSAGGEVVAESAERGPTRAEILASQIFRFVSVSSSLASSIPSATSSKGSSAAHVGGNGYRSASDDTSTEGARQETPEPNEVQLLRMRSKKHEIIIFPDPKFLCCVVVTAQRPSR